MSDGAGDNVEAKIDARLAALFRQLCRKELLDERETEELVSRAMNQPAPTRLHPRRNSAPALGRAARQQDLGTAHGHQQRFGMPLERASEIAESQNTETRDTLWATVRTGWRAALRRRA